jgi:NADPH:quinone reductase-like Zn-dependent oxidoreductase
VAGIVDRVGDGVTDWAPGERVLYHGDLSKPGGHAEFSLAPAHILTAIPKKVAFDDAAAIPCAGFTAFQTAAQLEFSTSAEGRKR